MRSPRVPGGSSAHFARKEHPQTTLLNEVEQGQRRPVAVVSYCNDHDYLPFFFFALLLGSLIVEFVEGPTVEGDTDDDDPSSGTGGDVPGPPTSLTTSTKLHYYGNKQSYKIVVMI